LSTHLDPAPTPPAVTAGRFTAEFMRATQLLSLARFAEAERALEVAGGVTDHDDEVALAALSRASIRFWHLADLAGAHRVLDEAAGRLGDRAAADDLAAQRAVVLLFSGRTARALVLCRRVRRRARGSTAARLLCAAVEAAGRGMLGDVADAAPTGEPVPDDALLAFGVGSCALAVAFARAVNGADALVAGSGAGAADRTRALVASASEGAADLVDATNLLWAGRPRAALAPVERGVAHLRRGDRIHLLASALGQLAYGRALLGDAPGATAAAEDAAASCHPLSTLPVFHVGRGAAWAAAARGELSAARERLVETAGACERAGQPVLAAQAWYDVARLGDPVRAAPPLQRIAERTPAPTTRRSGSGAGGGGPEPEDGALAPLLSAHVRALVDGDAAGVGAAAVRARRRGHLLHAAEAAAQAASLHGRRRRPEAERWATMARVLTEACEGARTPPLARLHDLDLTPREREIVGLVARGLSNPDIARRLHLSVRTVGNHLQASYGKLGVHRREELAHLHPFGKAD
jgi:DNA-binding CsgD family transcriptional regulator